MDYIECACCRNIFTPPEVWTSKTIEDLGSLPVDYSKLWSKNYSADCGPDTGTKLVLDLIKEKQLEKSDKKLLEDLDLNLLDWKNSYTPAHGICVSLYEQNPNTFKRSGDPVADSYAFVARENNAILVVADGVNWGERSRLAARCAITASINYLQKKIYDERTPLFTTKNAFRLMRQAFDKAQELILHLNGGLTTLNITLILPTLDDTNFCVCSVNVGDSLTFVYSKRYGMNELSIGSHDINSERDMRDVGGALGPVNGNRAHLENLTYSLTACDMGDIVFLTTDGVSDNFDPVVNRLAVPGSQDGDLASVNHKAEMLPHERHKFSVKRMEQVLHEHELETENEISAYELCKALIRNIKHLTQPKRDYLENPDFYSRKFKKDKRKEVEEMIKSQLRILPGKLDHATVVAYELGKTTELNGNI